MNVLAVVCGLGTLGIMAWIVQDAAGGKTAAWANLVVVACLGGVMLIGGLNAP